MEKQFWTTQLIIYIYYTTIILGEISLARKGYLLCSKRGTSLDNKSDRIVRKAPETDDSEKKEKASKNSCSSRQSGHERKIKISRKTNWILDTA